MHNPPCGARRMLRAYADPCILRPLRKLRAFFFCHRHRKLAIPPTCADMIRTLSPAKSGSPHGAPAFWQITLIMIRLHPALKVGCILILPGVHFSRVGCTSINWNLFILRMTVSAVHIVLLLLFFRVRSWPFRTRLHSVKKYLSSAT